MAAVLLGVPLFFGLFFVVNDQDFLPTERLGFIALASLIIFVVNLLAAGGIGFPGVSQTGWLLLALLVNQSSRPVSPPTKSENLETANSWGSKICITSGLVMISLVFLCQQTMLIPVIRGETILDQVRGEIELNQMTRSTQDIELAKRVDPHQSEVWRLASYHAWLKWQQSPNRERFEAFETSLDQWKRCNPNSRLVFRQAGIWYLMAHQKQGQLEYLDSAVSNFQQAVEKHPNSGMMWAQLAWTLREAQKGEQAKFAAEKALLLDSQNPHSDVQLQHRYLIDGTGGVIKRNAELIMDEIRKTKIRD